MIQNFMVLEGPGRNKESEKCWEDTVKGRYCKGKTVGRHKS
jgi:hypothetical protein